MNFRLIEYYGEIYVVLGIGYDAHHDPPDVFYCVKLEDSIIRSILSEQYVIAVPISQADEITDEERIKTIWILYGPKT